MSSGFQSASQRRSNASGCAHNRDAITHSQLDGWRRYLNALSFIAAPPQYRFHRLKPGHAEHPRGRTKRQVMKMERAEVE